MGDGAIAPPFLTSTLVGGEWSISRPGLFTPWERTSETHCIGGCLAPEPGSRRCGVEKNLFSLPGIEPRPLSQWSVAVPTELSRLTFILLIICREYDKSLYLIPKLYYCTAKNIAVTSYGTLT
jgi:hypothetical protein